MKKVSYLLFLLCCFFAKGQSVSNAQTLQNKMSVKVLSAYQENTSNKVVDLFSYFQMLTDVSFTDDVKKEVVTNINLLFNNQNPMVIDFTSESNETILLQKLIQKLLVSEPLFFKVSEEIRYDSLTDKSWNDSYIVARTKVGATKYFYTNQTVFMLMEEKKFGENSKTIWTIFLGAMN
jgi:hypothetical protein